ncbi:MAG: hypothetical protein IIZ07_03765 [Ruminococcus sp.]|nr:hypothetical protein [Ruminococcus sp.]
MNVTEQQLDIFEEAGRLIEAAKRECFDITLSEALQIMIVQRLDDLKQ